MVVSASVEQYADLLHTSRMFLRFGFMMAMVLWKPHGGFPLAMGLSWNTPWGYHGKHNYPHNIPWKPHGGFPLAMISPWYSTETRWWISVVFR